jgi:hypothetical protein
MFGVCHTLQQQIAKYQALTAHPAFDWFLCQHGTKWYRKLAMLIDCQMQSMAAMDITFI